MIIFKICKCAMNFDKLGTSKKKAIADEVYEWYEKKYQIEIPLQEKQEFWVGHISFIEFTYSSQNLMNNHHIFSIQHVTIPVDWNCLNGSTMLTLKPNQLTRRLIC